MATPETSETVKISESSEAESSDDESNFKSPGVSSPYDTNSFDESVKRKCYPEPILQTTLTSTMICDNSTDSYHLTVRVYRATYGPYLYYSIRCDVPWTGSNHRIHPFGQLCYIDIEVTDELWNVVADNDLVRRILEYIAMPDEQLEQKTGHKHQRCYRAKLIETIAGLAD
jgi:hypothetical protein